MTETMVGPVMGCAGPLVGREREREILELALVRLARGSSQVIGVTGDPGIGKARLLAELARRAAEHGFPVLAGRAPHTGERMPFCALADALDDHLAGLGHGADLDALARSAGGRRYQAGVARCYQADGAGAGISRQRGAGVSRRARAGIPRRPRAAWHRPRWGRTPPSGRRRAAVRAGSAVSRRRSVTYMLHYSERPSLGR
jgi:AAA ATPase domain